MDNNGLMKIIWIERRDRSQLWQEIVQVWEDVSEDFCHKSVISMQSRLVQVI